jgi:hypothetical protein
MTTAASRHSCSAKLSASPPRPLLSLCIVMMISLADVIAATMSWRLWADQRRRALIQINKPNSMRNAASSLLSNFAAADDSSGNGQNLQTHK